MKTRIHVNRHNIARNKKGGNAPVFSAKDYRQNRKGNRVQINGPAVLVYRPEHPLPCGAVAWIETDSEVEVS
jgi:hypothetical protein